MIAHGLSRGLKRTFISVARRFNGGWVIPFTLFLAYILFASTLAIRQHDSFHTHAFDMAYFDNVLWNTSQGRLFVNDLPDKPRIFLGEHFSPALIALAPLYWLCSDARVLLIAQSIALALSVVPPYLLVRQRQPHLALLVMLAFYLNPAMLGVALSEFHEIALAAPLVSWGLWALVQGTNDERRTTNGEGQPTYPFRLWSLGFGLFLGALLVKEEIAVIVAAVGLYLAVRAWRGRFTRCAPRFTSISGVALIAIAVAWLAFVWGVLPGILSDATSHWQVRYGDIAPTPWLGLQRLLSDPAFLIGRYASPAKFAAIARVLWPLAFVPLLAPQLFALALPAFAYLLLSNKASVSQLQFWYVTPLLPILFSATAVSIARAPLGRARLMSVALLIASALAYWSLGAGPLSQNVEPARFAVTERTTCGHRLLQLIPASASISAQDNLLPHLAHRHDLYVFPSMGEPLAEYVALDARYEVVGGYSNWPLFRRADVPAVLNRFLSQPTYALLGDGCDYKILRYTGTLRIAQLLRRSFGGQIALLGYEIAVADEQGLYWPANTWKAGQALRLILWWQATPHIARDYTVFVHALDEKGRLVGQHDSPPANGFRPTAQWAEGDIVKDIHYFTLAGDAAQIEVGLYDGQTQQRLMLEDGSDAVRILSDR